MFSKLKKQFEDFGKKLDKEPRPKKPAIIIEMEQPVDYFPNDEEHDQASK